MTIQSLQRKELHNNIGKRRKKMYKASKNLYLQIVN